jgi:uncharacterized membrane protein YgcG
MSSAEIGEQMTQCMEAFMETDPDFLRARVSHRDLISKVWTKHMYVYCQHFLGKRYTTSAYAPVSIGQQARELPRHVSITGKAGVGHDELTDTHGTDLYMWLQEHCPDISDPDDVNAMTELVRVLEQRGYNLAYSLPQDPACTFTIWQGAVISNPNPDLRGPPIGLYVNMDKEYLRTSGIYTKFREEYSVLRVPSLGVGTDIRVSSAPAMFNALTPGEPDMWSYASAREVRNQPMIERGLGMGVIVGPYMQAPPANDDDDDELAGEEAALTTAFLGYNNTSGHIPTTARTNIDTRDLHSTNDAVVAAARYQQPTHMSRRRDQADRVVAKVESSWQDASRNGGGLRVELGLSINGDSDREDDGQPTLKEMVQHMQLEWLHRLYYLNLQHSVVIHPLQSVLEYPIAFARAWRDCLDMAVASIQPGDPVPEAMLSELVWTIGLLQAFKFSKAKVYENRITQAVKRQAPYSFKLMVWLGGIRLQVAIAYALGWRPREGIRAAVDNMVPERAASGVVPPIMQVQPVAPAAPMRRPQVTPQGAGIRPQVTLTATPVASSSLGVRRHLDFFGSGSGRAQAGSRLATPSASTVVADRWPTDGGGGSNGGGGSSGGGGNDGSSGEGGSGGVGPSARRPSLNIFMRRVQQVPFGQPYDPNTGFALTPSTTVSSETIPTDERPSIRTRLQRIAQLPFGARFSWQTGLAITRRQRPGVGGTPVTQPRVTAQGSGSQPSTLARPPPPPPPPQPALDSDSAVTVPQNQQHPPASPGSQPSTLARQPQPALQQVAGHAASPASARQSPRPPVLLNRVLQRMAEYRRNNPAPPRPPTVLRPPVLLSTPAEGQQPPAPRLVLTATVTAPPAPMRYFSRRTRVYVESSDEDEGEGEAEGGQEELTGAGSDGGQDDGLGPPHPASQPGPSQPGPSQPRPPQTGPSQPPTVPYNPFRGKRLVSLPPSQASIPPTQPVMLPLPPTQPLAQLAINSPDVTMDEVRQ